jgi:hypothetical protein
MSRYGMNSASLIRKIPPKDQINNIYSLACRSSDRIAEVPDAGKAEVFGKTSEMTIWLSHIPTKVLRQMRRRYTTNIGKCL